MKRASRRSPHSDTMIQPMLQWVMRATAPVIIAAMVMISAPAYAQTFTLNAHPGPANNGGSPGWAIFFDVTSTSSQPILLQGMTTASTAAAGANYTVEVFSRSGSGLGGPVASGPGSSPAGWTSHGTANVTQGPVASQVSLPFAIPDITLNPGETRGIAVQFSGVGPRYFGTGSPPHGNYSDANLSLVTGEVRSIPFTTTGTFFSSRELVGSISYQVIPEPGSAALISLLGLGLVAVRRRRK